MQRLLVGQRRRGHDPQPDRQLAVAEHGHGAEEEDRHRGDLGGQAERAILGAGDQRVAGEDQRRYRQERRQQHPWHAAAARQEARHGPDQREQDEGPEPDAFQILALALLALHADQGADQQRDGEVPDDADIEGLGHA